MWLIVISSNLNLTLRLFFCPNNNNLSLKIYCKNIVNILFLFVTLNCFNFQAFVYLIISRRIGQLEVLN